MKAILVIDMPISCSECPCCYIPRCEVLEKSLKTSEIYECKPDWCPLRPAPEKRQTLDNFWEMCANIVRNACIDEILGDKE